KASVIAFLLISIPSAIKYYIESESKERNALKNQINKIMGSRQAITQVPELHKGGNIRNISKDSRDDQIDQVAGSFDNAIDNIHSIISSVMIEANSSVFLRYNMEEEQLYLQSGITKSEKGLNYQIKIPEGGGIIGWVAKEKKMFNFSSLDPSRDRLDYYNERTRIRSLLAMPLLDNENLEGIICVDALKEGAFTKKDEDLIGLFAKEIGYQLKNMREKKAIHTRTHELSSILEISTSLNTRLDLMHRLETMADKAKEILEYDYCFIVLIDERETHGTVKVARGHDGTGIIDKRFKITEGLLNIILKNRQCLMFSNIELGSKTMNIFPKEFNLSWKARSFIGIPMMIEERIIGIFMLTSQKDNAFNAYDQHILSIICSHAAVSISDASLHAQVEALATTDGLTGISNHRHFQERLNAEFERIARHPEPISLILIDLDHFKKINDNFGHPVGDIVLKKIAKILLNMTRKIDTVARYGGEEFVLLLLKTDKKQAIQMAERIRKTVETTKFEFDGKKIPVTLSLGMAATPSDTKSKKELIELADKALYHSKHSGRNQATHISDIDVVQ
ncbi:MAG TPA: diguanylate cyclase, partial [Nitrospiria bacterium]|nr:diguanylate cyclase [Nitrospiria bacterium]